MKPFILKSTEFNHEKMEVIAHTDCGIFRFPVLPPRANQEHRYETGFENGRYVIRTRDYNRLKFGDYGKDEEINLAHEVCHYDKRVICPMHSFAHFMKGDIQPKLWDFLRGLGFDGLLDLHNMLEDLFANSILVEIGYPRSKIRDLFSKNMVGRLKVAEKMISLVNLQFDVPALSSEDIFIDDAVNLPWGARLWLVGKMHWSIDLCLFEVYRLLKGFEGVDPSSAIEWYKSQLEVFNRGSWPDADYKSIEKLCEFFNRIGLPTYIMERVHHNKNLFQKFRLFLEISRLTDTPDNFLTWLDKGLEMFF